MEEERYEDVIDDYEKGVGVKPGETLTEYIKRNNIKIMDPEPRTEKMGGGIMRKMLRAGDDPRDFEDEVEELLERVVFSKRFLFGNFEAKAKCRSIL